MMSDDYDMVNPAHYKSHPSGVECIHITRWFPTCIGTAIKYLWRAGLKPGADHIEDLRKSIRYIEFEIERLEMMKHDSEQANDWTISISRYDRD